MNNWITLKTGDGSSITVNINGLTYINKDELFIGTSDCSRFFITRESMKFLCDTIGVTWRE
jgi:hypothetical protein